MTSIADALGRKVSISLPGLHAYTGCDTVSAFASKGKLTALKALKANEQYQNLFADLGATIDVSEELVRELEVFTCHLYGGKGITDVNELRYAMFCAKKGELESYQLPPCRYCLFKHILRANYQALVWKSCLVACPVIPAPIGHGWKHEGENDAYAIDWMSVNPAPNAVLEFLSCNCSRSCESNRCSCVANGLKCTDMCRLRDCTNQETIEVDEVLAGSDDEGDDKNTDIEDT